MAGNRFFEKRTEQSAIKAAIVAKYFMAWASIIGSTVQGRGGKIAYIDLFAGPGSYKDGFASTPILVLQKAINDPKLSRILVSIFNDCDARCAQSLQTTIQQLPGIDTLNHAPRVFNLKVDEVIAKIFTETHIMPGLFFLDPWGYKGLSADLINAVIKDWACECIFFFNYNRVNLALSKHARDKNIDALIGKETANALRVGLKSLSPQNRELAIVEALRKALDPTGKRYVLVFRFKTARGTRTSHHLFFVSKHFLGYDTMKHIMAKQSSAMQQGVATFEYNPADRRHRFLFDLAKPLDDLEDMLLRDFAGRTVAFKQLYESHSVGKPYVDSNYKEILKKMEKQGMITAVKPGGRKRIRGFANDVLITFLRKGK
jgi:three-Cys-motif partner protein